MGNQQNVNELKQKELGVPHIQNNYWKMARQGKIRSLLNAFKQAEIDCYTIIVPQSGHTLLHQAITLNRNQLFKICQIYGANWDQTDLNGVTPLMKAAALNRVHFLEKLIELGVDKDIKAKNGRTAVDFALLYENTESIDILNSL